jgi:hypothetical protein
MMDCFTGVNIVKGLCDVKLFKTTIRINGQKYSVINGRITTSNRS